MKKIIITAFIFLIANSVWAKTDLTTPELMSNRDLLVITKGESFNYPIPEESIIACYAKRIDGSIDAFEEYNDYFLMRNGHLYSNTMNKIYKPLKAHKLKKVDQARILGDKKTLKLYDPLWEGSFRHHMRGIKINTKTGEYFMRGTQDNWTWYRNITATGSCKVVK